ncbi:MAG: SMC-Scp complex subunit ScpB [Cyanobacteria bacterium M5B4]|nr:MAG: SMC-Scp complex subunit ScpB [Cyanobacteria bacterium M5B4]
MNFTAIIEAILYLKAKPLTIGEIAQIAGCPIGVVEAGIIDLIADYGNREGALEIAETEGGYCLRLRPEFEQLVQKILPLEIGKGALRTLAAIALKNPISQAELVELRGSSAYQQIQELMERGFVRRRKQADGRSYWLTVTEKFHQYFEVSDLSNLVES